jgi:hypothetical protein
MGYQSRYDIVELTRGIRAMHAEINNGYSTGWNQWPVKQQMYQLKWLIEESLESSNTFADETTWLCDQEQQRLIQLLKK